MKPCVTSDEEKLSDALTELTIIKTEKPFDAIKEALRMAMVLVGLRAANVPQSEEKGVLMAYIIENYGGHTPKEIKLAFTLAVSGKLNLEAKDVVCYENFSILYFSTIMNAYREWSKQAFCHLPKNKTLSIEYKNEVSDDEFIMAVESIYLAHRNWIGIPALAYDVLERNGKINISTVRKIEVMSEVYSLYSELSVKATKDYCKAYCVGLYFDNKL